MSTRIAWMFDHDGIRQTRFTQPFLEYDADATRVGKNRNQRDIRVRSGQVRQVKWQARTDHDCAHTGFARLTHVGGIFRDCPHNIYGNQAISTGNLSCRVYFTIDGKQIHPVNEILVAAFCRLRHQVGMMAPQIHARQRTDGAGSGNVPGKPMRGDADAHTALNNRQQCFSLDAQYRVGSGFRVQHGGVPANPWRGQKY